VRSETKHHANSKQRMQSVNTESK